MGKGDAETFAINSSKELVVEEYHHSRISHLASRVSHLDSTFF